MSRKRFTTSEGLQVQFAHLAAWKTKLNTVTYKAVAAECETQNRLLTDKSSGFDVFRGQDLTTFIENYRKQ